ncbi:MAG: hypothetical protein K2X07_03875 [Caulobacteraceae bacterium]|nr:hypothetical protein [Caulobacteraceae bacterium]
MSLIGRLLAIAVLLGTFVLLIGPATTMETTRPGVDKAAHFIAFGLVLWPWGCCFGGPLGSCSPSSPWSSGGLTEIVQAVVGRDAELLDFVADSLGVMLALLAWSVWRGFRPRRAATPAR